MRYRVYTITRGVWLLGFMAAAWGNSMATSSSLVGQWLVIKDAVVEMTGEYPAANDEPVSPFTRDGSDCRREYQGLYNDCVECIEERDDQVKVRYLKLHEGNASVPGSPLHELWAFKKHFVSYAQLAKAGLTAAIPNSVYAQGSTIVLIYPWQTFSVGTRFVHQPAHDTPTHYAVLAINYPNMMVEQWYIPHESALREEKRSAQHARQLFITVLNQLLDRLEREQPGRVIPYVWGGSSFVRSHAVDDWYKMANGATQRVLVEAPYTGYDCSALITRMAQIVGINFPWKQSRLIRDNCRPLTKADTLEAGDIIWYPGHVLVVNNVEKNEVLEAWGYDDSLCGCVHRIALRERFAGIATFDDLLAAYYEHKPLFLLSKKGEVFAKRDECVIVKLV